MKIEPATVISTVAAPDLPLLPIANLPPAFTREVAGASQRALVAARPIPAMTPLRPAQEGPSLESPEARKSMPISSPAPFVSPSLAPSPRDRLSGSAWLFARSGDTSALAPGGSLGGSQLGGRISYRLNDDTAGPLALSGRIYAPLDRLEGAEAAVGVDWKPLADLPLHLLVERRQALGEDGRSAFSATAYGGVSEEPVGPLRVDGYVQAGVVGVRSKDLFVDGSVKLSLPMDDVKIGAGVWAAAQPGVSRVDIGPQASAHVPGTDLIISADWRLRIAGDAVPDSGPTITVAVDF